METIHGELGLTVWPTLCRVLRALVGLPPLLLILGLCWYNWKYRRILSVARKLPVAVLAIPIVGHAHLALYGAAGLVTRIVRAGKEEVAKGTKTMCLWMGPYPVFFVRAAEDINTVVTSSKTSEKSGEYNFIRFALGNGVLTAPGHIHRITRRHLNPIFQPRNLEKLMSVFNESSRILVKEMSQHAGFEHFNVQPSVTTIALRNICCVIFGPDTNVDTHSEEFRRLLRAVDMIAHMLISRFFKIWLWPEAVFRLLWRREIIDVFDSYNKFAEGRVKECVDKQIDGDGRNSEDAEVHLTVPEAHRALRTNYPDFQEQELQDEMITLLVTGTDTTKTAISSCLLALAAHQDIQERLYQEIVTVAGPEDSEVTAEDIRNMPYLDMVLRETLRKFTVVPLISRHVRDDISLRDCTVPAGSTIVMSLFSLHYDPQSYPDPEKFEPERFSPENTATTRKHAFLPFSGGSRDCIGRFSAIMLAKTVVIHVLRRYRLSTNMNIPNMRYTLALALTSVEGYRLRAERRA